MVVVEVERNRGLSSMWREVEGCRRCGEKWRRVVVDVERSGGGLSSMWREVEG
jgi:hypothetical protein